MGCSSRFKIRALQFLSLPILAFLCPGSRKLNLAFAQAELPDVSRSFANVQPLDSVEPALHVSDESNNVKELPFVECGGQQLPVEWDAVIRPWVREGSTAGPPQLVVVMAGRLEQTARRIVHYNVAKIKQLHPEAGIVVAAGGITAQTVAATVAALRELALQGVGVLTYSDEGCGAMGGFSAAVHAGVHASQTVVMMQANMWIEERLPQARCGFVPLWHFNAHFFNKPLLVDPEATTHHTHAWVVQQADALGLELDDVFRDGGAVDECGVFGGSYILNATVLNDMLLRGLFHLAIPSKLHATLMERLLAFAMRVHGCNPCEDAIDGDIHEVWDAMPGFSHEFDSHRHLGKYFGSRKIPAHGFWSDSMEIGLASNTDSRPQAGNLVSRNGRGSPLPPAQHDVGERAEICFSQACCDGQSMLTCKMQTLDLDNKELPKGQRTAVIISGLLKECISEQMVLPSIVQHIVSALGDVDIFIHTSPLGNRSASETSELVLQGLRGADVRGMIIEPSIGFRLGLRKMFLQFARIREAFDLVLAEERVRNERYQHVVRLRPDSVWFSDWRDLDVIAPPGTAAGPGWKRGGLKLDIMWVASRGRAFELFGLLPSLFGRHVDRHALHHLIGCHTTEAALAEWCDECVFSEDYVCPEGYLAYFLYAGDEGGSLLRDSCALGAFVTHQSHEKFYQGCDTPLPKRTEAAARSHMRYVCHVDFSVRLSREQVLEKLHHEDTARAQH